MDNEVQKLIDRSIKKLKTLKDGNKAVANISDIIEQINKVDIDAQDPQQLLQWATKLSVLQFNLSPLVNRSKLTYNSTYLFRKVKAAQLWFSVTAENNSDRKELIQQQTKDIYEDEMYFNYEYESLEALYDNINRLISVLQSYVRYQQAQQRAANVQQG